MAWDPDTYNKFRSERKQPFYDCLELIKKKERMKILDLGCGTGELTYELSRLTPPPMLVLGIDSSPDMLSKSQIYKSGNLLFRQSDIESELDNGDSWDLIFSHAALQWVPGHKKLFQSLISRLNPGGQLVVQMPSQNINITNIILSELAALREYAAQFNEWNRGSPVLDPGEYVEILFRNGGKQITVFEKIYPVLVPDVSGLVDWVSGTALIPYLERLSKDRQERFILNFRERLQERFPGEPVFYPFRRILISAFF